MKIDSLNFNTQMLDSAMSREAMIELLEEACAEFECIHAHMAKILEKRHELV